MRNSSFNNSTAFNQSDLNIFFPIISIETVVLWLKASIGSLSHYKYLPW